MNKWYTECIMAKYLYLYLLFFNLFAEGTVFNILDTNFQFIGEMKKNKNNWKPLIEWFIYWLIDSACLCP